MGNILDCRLPKNFDEVQRIFDRAAYNDDRQIVHSILLQLDAERKLNLLTRQDDYGNSVIHNSVTHSSRVLNTFLDLLNVEERFIVLSVKNDIAYTPLHMATAKRACNAAETILSSINKDMRLKLMMLKDYLGSTALHIAANRLASMVMDSKMFEILVGTHTKDLNSDDHAVLLGALDNNGQTPLHLACLSGNSQVAFVILQRMMDCIPLKKSFLLLNTLSSQSENSPVHLAALYGLTDAINLMRECVDAGQWYMLLRQGNTRKSTPIHLAALSGNNATVLSICDSVTLEQFGILLSLKDEYKSTPLNIAFEQGHMEVVDTIRQKLNKKDWLCVLKDLHDEHINRKDQLLRLGASESILQSLEQGHTRMLSSIIHTEVELVRETDNIEGKNKKSIVLVSLNRKIGSILWAQ